MRSLSLNVASLLLGVTVAAPALGPVKSNGVPKHVPKNETELYPPYHFTPVKDAVFIPSHISVPVKGFNNTKKPWTTPETSGSSRRVKSHQAAACDSLSPSNPAAADYWYENIEHNGESPFINNGDTWQVFRNVVSDPYNADSTGANDAQPAIQKALDDGSSSGSSRSDRSLGTTGQPAVVYLPSGTYKIESPLQLYLDTVLMGNPIDPPTIKIAGDFSQGTAILGQNPNVDATTNFYIGIKNIKIDSTDVDKDQTLALLDWSVSQATQLANVVFNMPNFSSGHTGITMTGANSEGSGGGSGTMMGDLTFNGGVVGLNMNNQQYEGKSLTFNGTTTGILVGHCFDCVFVNCNFQNGDTGLDMTGDSIGSVVLLDSTAGAVNNVVKTNSEDTGDHTLVIGSFTKGDGINNVVTASGNNVLNDSVTDTWVYGNAYTAGGPATGSHQTGTTYKTPRADALLANGKYISIAPLTYQEYGVDQVMNVKSVPNLAVAGDGVTDDTANLNTIISMYAGCKVLFFPQGTYLVSDTLLFPPGSRIIGEAWSTISANGDNFSDSSNPRPLIKVGNSGDTGVAQFSDMLFTVADILPGCTLLEVNMAGDSPGDVGFWNTHFRVGGAMGSKVFTECPKDGDPANCKAAYLLAHLTSSSSVYIENMWGWTADHNLEGDGAQVLVATGRGMLVEATAATWLHGTAMEHNTLYQYNFNNAANVFVGMQQSETPYWQGNGSPAFAPAPWDVVSDIADPDFSNCDGGDAQCRMAVYDRIAGGSALFIYGPGFWTFFNHFDGGCQDSNVCQTNAIEVDGASGLYMFAINTHTSLNVLLEGGNPTVTLNNNPGGWGAVVGAYLADV